MVAAAVLLSVVGILGISRLGDQTPEAVPTVAPPPGQSSASFPDPYAWDPGRAADFERRAATGVSHLLYVRAPGGVLATAGRVARWRPQIDAAARAAGVNADTLEGLVFLESGGRDDAMTPGGIEGAVGLTQILAQTGSGLLGMKVDTTASARLTRRLDREPARGHEKQVAAPRRRRAIAEARSAGAKSTPATPSSPTPDRRPPKA